jgi:DNA-directed RNA polymerase subunit RPC12/RpoP
VKAKEVSYECVTCGEQHKAPEDNALALLKLCKGCGEKRYRKGKAEQRKALAPIDAATTGEKRV